MRPRPHPVRPGQESVWDYPRPPRLEPVDRHIVIEFGGGVIVETRSAVRILETSHPPVYYVPTADVAAGVLVPRPGTTHCEWKGQAAYFDVVVGDRTAEGAAWAYPRPVASFAALAERVAFYARPMDRCMVDGEVVRPQEGRFYGGWITSDLAGPFKGGPGSWGW